MNATRSTSGRPIPLAAIALLGVAVLVSSEIGPWQDALGGERSPGLPSAGMHVAIEPMQAHRIVPAPNRGGVPKLPTMVARPIGPPAAQQRPHPPVLPQFKMVQPQFNRVPPQAIKPQPFFPGHLADQGKAANQRPLPAPNFAAPPTFGPDQPNGMKMAEFKWSEPGRKPQVEPPVPGAFLVEPDQPNAPKMMQFKWSEPGRTPQIQPPNPDGYLIEPGQTGPKPPVKANVKWLLPGQAPPIKPIPPDDGWSPPGPLPGEPAPEPPKTAHFDWKPPGHMPPPAHTPDLPSFGATPPRQPVPVENPDIGPTPDFVVIPPAPLSQGGSSAPGQPAQVQMKWITPGEFGASGNGIPQPDPTSSPGRGGNDQVSATPITLPGQGRNDQVSATPITLPGQGRNDQVSSPVIPLPPPRIDEDGQASGAELPNERLPNQDLLPDQGRTPEKDITDDSNFMPDFSGGWNLDFSGLEDDSPAGNPDPFGDGDRDGSGWLSDSGDPGDRGPGGYLSNPFEDAMNGLNSMGKIPGQGDFPGSGDGGAKTSDGGPGRVMPNPTSGQHGSDLDETTARLARIAAFEALPAGMVTEGAIRQYATDLAVESASSIFDNTGDLGGDPDVSATGVPQATDDEDPPPPKKDNDCDGPIDTGGGRVGAPQGPSDVDRSKAGGGLVGDPAASQWFSGLSGVDMSNHPNQASNPGYDGGRGPISDGGVKHDPTLAGDPPQNSGN